MSKTSKRRKEKTKQVGENLAKVDWKKRDRSKDTFKVNIK